MNRKDTYRTYIGVDACMANLMRPGMYGAYHHITVLGKEDARRRGPTTSSARSARTTTSSPSQRELPEIAMGDLLVIHDTGAHGHAMGFNYNGKLRSAELLLRPDGSVEQIRRAETFRPLRDADLHARRDGRMMSAPAPRLTAATAGRVLVPFALAYFVSYLFRVVNAVIAPNLAAELRIGPADLGLLTSAYFVCFAAFQLPLGVLLDPTGRDGSKGGCSSSPRSGRSRWAAASLAGLVAGRAMIGLGVSAGYMAAIKAYTLWFPQRLWPRVNGLHLAAGGCGALTATLPVEFALGITDWRGVFLMLAVLSALVAAAVFFVVPELRRPPAAEQPGRALAGMADVFTSPVYWRVDPADRGLANGVHVDSRAVVRAVAAGPGRVGPGRHRRGALLDRGGHDGRLCHHRLRHRAARADGRRADDDRGVGHDPVHGGPGAARLGPGHLGNPAVDALRLCRDDRRDPLPGAGRALPRAPGRSGSAPASTSSSSWPPSPPSGAPGRSSPFPGSRRRMLFARGLPGQLHRAAGAAGCRPGLVCRPLACRAGRLTTGATGLC